MKDYLYLLSCAGKPWLHKQVSNYDINVASKICLPTPNWHHFYHCTISSNSLFTVQETRLLTLIEGVLAANIFDWGSRACVDLYHKGTIIEIYRMSRNKMQRPWRVTGENNL